MHECFMILSRFLLTFICIFSFLFTSAQTDIEVVDYPSQLDHLEPLDSSKFEYEVLKQYFSELFPLLYTDFKSKPILRYTALPSFENSYAFSLEEFNDVYYLKTNQLSENYWYSKNKNEVKVFSCSLVLDDSLSKSIIDLFAVVMSDVRPVEKTFHGMDGTSYLFHFTDENGKFLAGEAWSPANDNMKKLIGVCNQIFGVCERSKSKMEELRLKLKEVTKILME